MGSMDGPCYIQKRVIKRSRCITVVGLPHSRGNIIQLFHASAGNSAKYFPKGARCNKACCVASGTLAHHNLIKL